MSKYFVLYNLNRLGTFLSQGFLSPLLWEMPEGQRGSRLQGALTILQLFELEPLRQRAKSLFSSQQF